MKNIFQGIKKLPDFIYSNNKKIIIISSLFMCAAFIWSYAILSMPMVTHEDSFFMFDDFEDEAVPLGLLDTDNLNGMLCPYQDVATHWAKDAIVKVCDEYQIMSPISDDMFEPNKTITRGEFVTTLGRLENIDIIDKKVKTSLKPLQKKLYELFQKEIALEAEIKNNKELAESIDNVTKTFEKEYKRTLSPIVTLQFSSAASSSPLAPWHLP